jgi:hypothetical protein
MKLRFILLNVFLAIGLSAAASARPVSIPIENASFEYPEVDPNAFPALPIVVGWTEIDLDELSSSNTGVFANTDVNSADHITNADGRQLAFLGSQTDNALRQDLEAIYRAGCDYELTVGVGISSLFPPSIEEPPDLLELVFYYYDGNEPVDIASCAVDANGLASTELKDFSLYLPVIQPDDAWADMSIGIGLRAVGMPGGFWDLDNVRLIESPPVSIPVENASFEFPRVDPNAFPALPYIDGWTEFDVDTIASSNTGIFSNTSPDSWDHIINADGDQLVFLGSESGNGLKQDLAAVYKIGYDYQLTVGVGISSRFPPSVVEPPDKLELVFYYYDGNEAVDIISEAMDAMDLVPTELTDFSLNLPAVRPDDAWAEIPAGIAIRSAGLPGGFWDLDNVRLIESHAPDEMLDE